MPIRENKFARRAKERQDRQPNNALRDTQPTVDEQLLRLEDDVRRLKVEWDIFFNGAAKRPPYDTKSRIETLIKRIADDRTLTFAQRYRYNSVVARFTSFRELWRRTMQGREEGRDAVSLARSAQRQPSAQARIASPSTFVCANAHSEVPTVKELFNALVDAKKQCGEPTEDLTFLRFHRLIIEKSEALKERVGCERVFFSVDVADGRVSFKARPER